MFGTLEEKDLALHVRVLGSVVLVSGVMGIIGSTCLGLGLTVAAFSVSDAADVPVFVPLLGLGGALFAGVLSGISIAAGYGLLKRRRWARTLGLVDGLLGLIWFPLGTLFGLYAFWVLLRPEAEAYFETLDAVGTATG